MRLAKWTCYILLIIGFFGGVSKILEGDTTVGFQLIIFCTIVAGVGLVFVYFCLGLFGDDKKKNKHY
jgi:hypothetical protein